MFLSWFYDQQVPERNAKLLVFGVALLVPAPGARMELVADFREEGAAVPSFLSYIREFRGRRGIHEIGRFAGKSYQMEGLIGEGGSFRVLILALLELVSLSLGLGGTGIWRQNRFFGGLQGAGYPASATAPFPHAERMNKKRSYGESGGCKRRKTKFQYLPLSPCKRGSGKLTDGFSVTD